MMKYFDLGNIKTIADLKSAYKTLVKKYHPDNGGSVADMQNINHEYEVILTNFAMYCAKNQYDNSEEMDYEEYVQSAKDYADILKAIIGLDGLDIEICGTWVWVGGATLKYREQLKSAGFKWASKKHKWYYAPQGFSTSRKYKSKYTMDDIRSRYGSQSVKTEQRAYVG